MADRPQPGAPRRPPRLLGLDPGGRRTGVALSDELGMFAHVRPAIHASTDRELVQAVAALVAGGEVDEIIVGLPIGLGGHDTEQTRRTRELAVALRGACGVTVSLWDERLSSVEAGHALKGAARRRSGALDSAAAALILQAVLDARRLAAGR